MSKIYDNKAVTGRIVELIEKRGSSIYKLSKAIDTPYGTLDNNIVDDTKWGLNNLVKIAKHFNVTLDWLILGDDGSGAQYSPNELKRLQQENKKLTDELQGLQKKLDSIIGIAKVSS